MTKEDVLNVFRKADEINTEFFRARRTKPIPDDYVIDENKSVKWNREQVLEANQKLIEKIESLKNQNSIAYGEATKKAKEFIRIGTTFSDKQIDMIWDKAYEDGHSQGYDMVLQIAEDMVVYLEEFLKV